METLADKFKDAVKEMSCDDLPNEDLKDLANVCGIDMAIKLLQGLNGIHIYIPKDGFRKVVERFVIQNFDGTNAKKIALACDISEVHVYEIVRKEDAKKSENRAKNMQLNLLDSIR
jgi:Mor family transcriptional regulator